MRSAFREDRLEWHLRDLLFAQELDGVEGWKGCSAAVVLIGVVVVSTGVSITGPVISAEAWMNLVE